MQFICWGARIPTLRLRDQPGTVFPTSRFHRHRPWVSVIGLRFTLSLWMMNHSAWGHQFQYMVAMCHAQHLCNEKEKNNLKDPEPMFWLPAHPEVHIFTTTTAIKADKTKWYTHMKGVQWIHTYTWAYSFFILVPDLALNFYFIHHTLSRQPTNPAQTIKQAMLPSRELLRLSQVWSSSLSPLWLCSSKGYSSNRPFLFNWTNALSKVFSLN